jgi:hypothetical protein
MSSVVLLSFDPSSRHTATGRAQLPSPSGRKRGDEGLRITLTPNPSSPFPASGRAQLPSPSGRRDGDEGLRITLTPNPSPARGEGSVECACGAELEVK